MKKLFVFLLFVYAVGVSYLYLNKISLNELLGMVGLSGYTKNLQKAIAKEEMTKPIKEIKSDKNSSIKNTKKIVKKEHNKTKPIPKDAIVIRLPKVPKVEAKVPQVVTIGSSYKEEDENQKQLSMAMPVVHKPKPKAISKDNNTSVSNVSTIGLEHLGRVSTYLRGAFVNANEVKKRLEKSGFKILSTLNLDKDLTVIVFTSKELLETAKNSAYASNLRVLIDKKSKTISISNPIYFQKAFLRDKYNQKLAKSVLDKINSAFDGLKNSKDKLKETLLPEYHFMFGMPKYDDMIIVASASNTNTLISKLQNNKQIVFIQKITNKKYLVGVKLTGKSGEFYNKIGNKNALLLPYPMLIEDGKAKILNPKYYIALSYPLLKMSQFMDISSIPGEIEDECKKLFK